MVKAGAGFRRAPALLAIPGLLPSLAHAAPENGVRKPGRPESLPTQIVSVTCGQQSLTAVKRPAQARRPALRTLQMTEEEVAQRAFQYFLDRADPVTGLVTDRAKNGGADTYNVASIAATGYGLAALAIGAERGWIAADDARARAEKTLRFVHEKMFHNHGWLYHFVHKRTGARMWQCEVSSIDTALLVIGALACGQYFPDTEAQRIANALYDRMDWTWMRTNGGAKPDKLLLSHGWKPENGFLPYDWGAYCELMLLYLLGHGASRDPLPPESWTAWTRPLYRYSGMETLAGGPIFLHQMAHAFYNFYHRRDRAGYDYWVSATNATRIHRQFCLDRAAQRKTYGPDVWGLNACDGPDGYRAYGVPGPEDGTVATLAALTSISYVPDEAQAVAEALKARYAERLWGRYGFSDAFNLDRNWFDTDVIGIDLGMGLLALENYRSGLIWDLIASHPATQRALAAAGLHETREKEPRALRVPPPELRKAPRAPGEIGPR